MKYKTLSIVIPVYNEEKFILRTIKKVQKAKTLGLKKEIIIINDGSTDKTAVVLKKWITTRHPERSEGSLANARKSSNKLRPARPAGGDSSLTLRMTRSITIQVIFLKKNQGKCAAVKTGFLKSTGDIVLVQDADFEYDPSEYPLLLEPFLKHDADVVYGSRFISDRPHRVLYFWHYVGNILLTTFSNIMTNLNLTDMETGYKVFKGPLIRTLAKDLKSKRFGLEPEITARISKIKSIKIYEVGISYWGRTYAEGKKIGIRDGFSAIWQILRYNVFNRSS